MKPTGSNHSGDDPVTGQDQTVFVDVPTELGPYRLVKILGRGGMGEVWQAFDTNLERDVAVKLMRRELLANEEAVRRFGREARAVARLNHPNIVQVYAFGDQKGVLYFIMEMVEGETVGDLTKRQGCLTLEQAGSIMLQSVEGLSYASVRGIVHRDIKPSNLMLTPDARVKIADFGLAKMMEQDSQMTAAGSTMGSPNYMSPEQARGEEADHRSDIYSLGITFYQMLTGQLPFTAMTPLSVLLMQIQNPLPEPLFLKELADGRALSIIKRMTQKKAADRYQTYGEVAAELSALVPTARIGQSAYSGTMSMRTPDTRTALGGGEPTAERSNPSLTTAVGGGLAPTRTISAGITEDDLRPRLDEEEESALGADGATRTLIPPAPTKESRTSSTTAFVAGGVGVLVLAGAALFLWPPPPVIAPENIRPITPSGPAVSGATPPLPETDSSVTTAGAVQIASATPPPPAPVPVPPQQQPSPTPEVTAVPVAVNGPTGGTTPTPMAGIVTPTPALYAANLPPVSIQPQLQVQPPPVYPTPAPTPIPVTAPFADLAPNQPPGVQIQIYSADGQPAFTLPARTRVDYLEAATIGSHAMMRIGHRTSQGYLQGFVRMEDAEPVYSTGSAPGAVVESRPAAPDLPRTVMVGRPQGTGKFEVFEDARLRKTVGDVPPGTVLEVLDVTQLTYEVRLPNGRKGHVMKKVATPRP